MNIRQPYNVKQSAIYSISKNAPQNASLYKFWFNPETKELKYCSGLVQDGNVITPEWTLLTTQNDPGDIKFGEYSSIPAAINDLHRTFVQSSAMGNDFITYTKTVVSTTVNTKTQVITSSDPIDGTKPCTVTVKARYGNIGPIYVGTDTNNNLTVDNSLQLIPMQALTFHVNDITTLKLITATAGDGADFIIEYDNVYYYSKPYYIKNETTNKYQQLKLEGDEGEEYLVFEKGVQLSNAPVPILITNKTTNKQYLITLEGEEGKETMVFTQMPE